MSKWTLTRKTQAGAKSGLQNLREGWFKMKVDHRKTQGGWRFNFEKPLVRLQVEVRANKPSEDLGKRLGATFEIE